MTAAGHGDAARIDWSYDWSNWECTRCSPWVRNEAKTHLARLLDQVAQGEEITITKRGKPVARLVPIYVRRTEDERIQRTITEIENFTIRRPFTNAEILALIREGRKP